MTRWLPLLVLLATWLHGPRAASAFDVVINPQGEFADAYLIDGTEPPKRVVFIDPDPPFPDDPNGPPARVGRHVNGQLCFFPKGFGKRGQFILADDTYREACLERRGGPQARCSITNPRDRQYVGTDADGWGVFKRNGKWTGRVIHVDAPFNGTDHQGAIDPQGCAFDATGRFFGVDVGHGGFGDNDGAIVVFFPGKRNRYDTYCFLDKALASPGMPAMDDAGNLYVAEPAAGRVTRFSPPFPTSAADCANPERLVTTPPTKTVVLTAASGLATPVGLARVPGTTHYLVGSVVIPEIINEYDFSSATGAFVRTVVPTTPSLLNPIGIGVGSDRTVYYAELDLDPVTFGTRCGRVSRSRLGAGGSYLPSEVLGSRLRFPDGIAVVDSKQLRVRWNQLPPAPAGDPNRCPDE